MSTYVTHTTDADSTREFGARLAPLLQAGDLVMLSGELGAGKTTLAQGIGSALNVRGRVSSPTFIVARVHPSLAGGPDLVHVDAYRLTSLEESITLVEWGEGMVEGISDNRLEIKVERPQGGLAGADASGITDLGGVDDGARTITLTGYGPRWEKALDQL